MKRIRILLPLFLLAFLLFGCTEVHEAYSVTRNGTEFRVNTYEGTITDGTHIYLIDIRGDSTTIIYPNGARYYWTQNGMSGFGGWDDNYDPDTYADGDVLIDILSEDTRQALRGNIPAGILMIVIGAFNLRFPSKAWYLSYGWRFKDSEPSDTALVVARISGVVAMIIGFVWLFV